MSPRFSDQRVLDRLDDRCRLRHPARTKFATSHRSRLRADEEDAILLQAIDVAAGRWMQPHPDIHRGGREHAFICRQQNRGRHVVGQAAGHSRQDIRGRRGHDDKVGRSRQLDMPDCRFVCEAEQIVADRPGR